MIRPSIVARKNQEIDPISRQFALSKARCRMVAENSARLDRCLYGAGDFNIGHDCSHVSIKNDARVSHFPEGIATAADNAGMLTVERDTPRASDARQNNAHGHCAKPWDCLSEENCSKYDKNDEGEICNWLYIEWFSFVNK